MLKKSILQTIAYFDLFDFPLTAEEIQENLYKIFRPVHIKEVKGTLQQMLDTDVIENLKDYHVLKGRANLVETRKRHRFIAEKFWNRVKLYSRLIHNIPFVRMIAVCNTLAYDNPKEDSDIDLFIVIEKGRMWFARLFITLTLQFFGVRRHGEYVTGRFCLSFFACPERLNLAPLLIETEDPYLAYWAKQLSPISGEPYYQMFLKENSVWLSSYFQLPILPQLKHLDIEKQGGFKRVLEFIFGGFIGNFCEWILKKTFKKLTLRHSKHLPQTAHVVIEDELLKFHNYDRRREYYERWKEAVATREPLLSAQNTGSENSDPPNS